MLTASFEEIRLPILPGISGGTRAAGAGASFANDNLPRLRTLSDAIWLAGRVALTQLRSVVKSGRTITTTLKTNCFGVIQRVPNAVTVIASACPFPVLSRHQCLCIRVVEFEMTTGGFAGVGQAFSDLRKGAGHDRRH